LQYDENMTPLPPDGSRDRRIEDPTNLWLIHPAGRRLLPYAVGWGISANMVSLAGLAIGVGAVVAYSQWTNPAYAALGLLLSIGWLIADGLDGMVARATGTASAVGRILDGLCDHGVFVLIYLALAISIGTAAGWALALVAGAAHAVQSSLYEGERARYHRRIKGRIEGGARPPAPTPSRLPFVRLYDRVAGSPERMAAPFDALLEGVADDHALVGAYASRAAAPLRLMRLLSANTRVVAIFVASIAGDPAYFWWFEIVPLTLVLVAGLGWHRRVESSFVGIAPDVSPHSVYRQGSQSK
jgi:CDP-diacylglycerol--serine O-phosphatidyltransferase